MPQSFRQWSWPMSGCSKCPGPEHIDARHWLGICGSLGNRCAGDGHARHVAASQPKQRDCSCRAGVRYLRLMANFIILFFFIIYYILYLLSKCHQGVCGHIPKTLFSDRRSALPLETSFFRLLGDAKITPKQAYPKPLRIIKIRALGTRGSDFV